MYMCTELLPAGGYPIAVKYIITNHVLIRKKLLSLWMILSAVMQVNCYF